MYVSIGLGVACVAMTARAYYVVCRRSPVQRCAVHTHAVLQEIIIQAQDTYDTQALIGKLIPWIEAAERKKLRRDWAVLSVAIIRAQRAFEQVGRMQHPKTRASLGTYRAIQQICATAIEASQEAAVHKQRLLNDCARLTAEVEQRRLKDQFGQLRNLHDLYAQLLRQGFEVSAARIERLQDDLDATEAIMTEKPGVLAFDLLAKTEQDLREAEQHYQNVPRLSERYGLWYDREVSAFHLARERYADLACRMDSHSEQPLSGILDCFDRAHTLLEAARQYVSASMLQWELGQDALGAASELLAQINSILDMAEKHIEPAEGPVSYLFQQESA